MNASFQDEKEHSQPFIKVTKKFETLTSESSTTEINVKKRTVNWSRDEKMDLLLRLKENRDILESTTRNKKTRNKRKNMWEHISAQFKIQHSKFSQLKTQGFIEQYQRLKSQVKKYLAQKNVNGSNHISTNAAIVKIMLEICQEEFKDYIPVCKDNQTLMDVDDEAEALVNTREEFSDTDNIDENFSENNRNEDVKCGDYISLCRDNQTEMDVDQNVETLTNHPEQLGDIDNNIESMNANSYHNEDDDNSQEEAG